MFLYTNDYEEDMQYLRDGYGRGIITPERLDEAVYRILATKACMNLHKKKKSERVAPATELEKSAVPNSGRSRTRSATRQLRLLKTSITFFRLTRKSIREYFSFRRRAKILSLCLCLSAKRISILLKNFLKKRALKLPSISRLWNARKLFRLRRR